MLFMKLHVGFVTNELQKTSDGDPLILIQKSEAGGRIRRVRKMKTEVEIELSGQLCKHERRQMKPHTFTVEEGKAAMAFIQAFYRDAAPIIHFIQSSRLCLAETVCIVVQRLPLQ